MKDHKGYKVQLVGNLDTVKRMVASLFLVDAKKEKQMLKVCICDDLPHVINAVDGQQRNSPSHELVQSGLILQVGYGRSLTIKASAQDDNELCDVDPKSEVVIPPDAIWASNAAFATDFHLRLKRPHENTAVQVSITSKDDYDSDIPLSVPPRVHITWQPKDVAGVQRIRKAWEMTEAHTLPRTPSGHLNRTSKSSSLPRYQQPTYQGIERMLAERRSGRLENGTSPHFQPTRTTTLPRNLRSSYSGPTPYSSKPVPVQDKNWNVVSPVPSSKEDDNLPQWAKGYGDQFDYDDVVVV